MLVQSVAEAGIEAVSMANRRNAGDLYAEPRGKIVRTVKDRAAGKAKAGETLLDLFARYAKQRVAEGAKSADGVTQDRMVITQFAEFVGPDRAPKSITKDDARDYKQAVERIPANYAKMAAYRGLNVRQAIEKADKLEAKRLSMVTQARYLSAVSPFFDWLRTQGYTDTQPFDGLHINLKNRKGKNPRPPFTAVQLNKILASPLFTGFLADGREHVAGNQHTDDWRYWVPLICIFTGARIGEVAQLRANDIEQQHGHWFVHLRDDMKTGQKTKSGKSRTVAVHLTLEAIGFIDFCERRRRGVNGGDKAPLFPELGPDKRNQAGAMPSRFWRDYLAAIGIKGGADGVGAHSFRHTMADELRKAGFLDEQFGPMILGHAHKTVTGGYGNLRQGTAQMLRDMIAAVKFEGVDFQHLIDFKARTAQSALD